MKKILIFIFIVSIPHSAYSKMSTEEFYSMFGSAIGVISSNSCGTQTSYANKAEKAVMGMLKHDLETNAISKSEFDSLKHQMLSLKDNDTNMRHPSATCESAKNVLDHLFK